MALLFWGVSASCMLQVDVLEGGSKSRRLVERCNRASVPVYMEDDWLPTVLTTGRYCILWQVMALSLFYHNKCFERKIEYCTTHSAHDHPDTSYSMREESEWDPNRRINGGKADRQCLPELIQQRKDEHPEVQAEKGCPVYALHESLNRFSVLPSGIPGTEGRKLYRTLTVCGCNLGSKNCNWSFTILYSVTDHLQLLKPIF